MNRYFDKNVLEYHEYIDKIFSKEKGYKGCRNCQHQISPMRMCPKWENNVRMGDLISRQDAIDALKVFHNLSDEFYGTMQVIDELPSVKQEQEDYMKMKCEFLRMASYIDVILECSDEQKETLLNFISRLAEFMPWTEED